jgi:steroid delta-isomerase-like uncharacterized protein
MATDIEKRIRDYFESWSSHDVDKVASFFVDDLVYEDVPIRWVQRGKDEFRANWGAFFDACPDFNIELKALVASGDRVATEWVMTGKLTKDLHGLPATGKGFSIRGASISELRGDKISQNRDYWDSMELLRQVGLMPETASA